jgi:DNA-directed RNA polymerase beta subunit
VSRLGSLDKLPSGALTPSSNRSCSVGLAQALEEINPAEVFDKQSRVTRLGEGGIPSMDAIPDEARSSSPATWGSWTPCGRPSRSASAST